MKMKMKSVLWVFLLVLVSVELKMLCEGCWKHERQALLRINARFGNSLPWADDTDCCHWHRVGCNPTTRRVEELDLSEFGSSLLGNFSDVLVFEDLKSLYLSGNSIDGCVENQGLKKLEVLEFDRNLVNNSASILACFGGLSSLKALYLAYNELNATSFHAFETLSTKLLNLEILDVRGNYLTNDILPSLGRFRSLNTLCLDNVGLYSDLHIQGLASTLINLEVLDMSENNFNNSDIASSLSGLSSLKSLSLTRCQLTSTSIYNISKLKSLEILDLAWNNFNNSILQYLDNENFAWPTTLNYLGLRGNNFSNDFLSSLTGLRNLTYLDLSFNQLDERSLDISDKFELKKLEALDLRFNEIKGPLPSSFGNMTSLQMLELSHNHLTGNFGSKLAKFTSLEYLGFEENQFEIPISFTPFGNLSKLKFIHGNGNKVIIDPHPALQTFVPKFQLQELELSSISETNSLPFPYFLLYQYNLSSLNFRRIKFKGEFPNWLLENNTRMTQLALINCSIAGSFHLPSYPLLGLQGIDVSDNAITGQIPSYNWSSIFPNLMYLNMSSNVIEGSLPGEFGQMYSLQTMDLSNNKLSGEIPNNITGGRSWLRNLDLSNNELVGTLSPLSNLKRMKMLYLHGNGLSGSIPSNLFNTSLLALYISSNHLEGKLPSHAVGNSSNLEALSMSNNHLGGSIPTIFEEFKYLYYLDISRNNLTGAIPSFVNSSMIFIHLNNNKLSGLVKRRIRKSSSLVVLDLGYNKINSNIDDLIQDLHSPNLNILSLKGNHFTGNIPKQICQLTSLIILDLSYNNLSGPISNCLGNMPFGKESSENLYKLIFGFYFLNSFGVSMPEKDDFTTKKISYTYTRTVLVFMNGIDLSSNQLSGSIPSELGNLTKIRALNLSHNFLSGQIPTTFSNFVQIESLDLSFNKLSGRIPLELNELTSLAVFSVAYNNLSGATPDRKGQFMTFDESSYEGNPFLCGPPLPKGCTATNGPYVNGDNDGSLVDMYVFYVSFAVSYASALLIVAATLYINPYWRQAWFYYMELIITNCYYFVEDNLCHVFKY